MNTNMVPGLFDLFKMIILLAALGFSGCLDNAGIDSSKDAAKWFRSDSGLGAAAMILPANMSENLQNYLVWTNDSSLLAAGGNSSAIVADEKVFITGSNSAGNFMAALSFADGSLVWKKDFAVAENFEAGEYGLACSSPCYGDGKIVGFFADGMAYCLNVNGELVWSAEVVSEPVNSFGLASSPVICDENVIFQVDLDEDMETEEFKSFILALSLSDGSELWRKGRDVWPSWSTPVVLDGVPPRLLTTAAEWAIMYNTIDGSEIWRCGQLVGDVASTAVVDDSLTTAYLFGDPSGEILAVKIEGSGDISQSNVLWRSDVDLPDVSSGLYWQGKIYYCGSAFELHCLDAKTGTQLWAVELDEAVYASPIVLGGKICLIDTAGNFLLYNAETGVKNFSMPLDDEINATAAVAADGLVIRGREKILRLTFSK